MILHCRRTGFGFAISPYILAAMGEDSSERNNAMVFDSIHAGRSPAAAYL